ncbi:MAG: DUF3501 family protein [Acidimicrobiales bacterium]
MTRLTLDDIADRRAYEREREGFRQSVIALKQRRRIHVGPFVTMVFENRDTIRYQIQEMARVEKTSTDEAIQNELDTYNPLIPEPGNLAATLFIELTSDADLRGWLPQLVGIERHVAVRTGQGAGATEVRVRVDPDHEKQLTREEITASVHYVHFAFTPEQIEAFGQASVTLVLDHPAYEHETVLSDGNRVELLAYLTG